MATPTLYPQYLKRSGLPPSLYPQYLWPIVEGPIEPEPGGLPDKWAYADSRWFVGDREPALAYPFTTREGYAILGDTQYLHFFNLNRPSGVTAVVDSLCLFLEAEDTGEPTYVYTWVSGGLEVTGRHRGQFKSVRQDKTIYADRFHLNVRPPV